MQEVIIRHLLREGQWEEEGWGYGERMPSPQTEHVAESWRRWRAGCATGSQEHQYSTTADNTSVLDGHTGIYLRDRGQGGGGGREVILIHHRARVVSLSSHKTSERGVVSVGRGCGVGGGGGGGGGGGDREGVSEG